ncbi:MAG: hypothetical protein JW891_00160 [Candidatus Lokiarchaeota archaeon]|nr:hypothetical protein [Candidatus Lokiarchaeota archaeon]
MRKEKQLTLISVLLLVISLVSGGAAAILVEGVPYDIIYALHKVSSVLFVIAFVVFLVRLRKE